MWSTARQNSGSVRARYSVQRHVHDARRARNATPNTTPWAAERLGHRERGHEHPCHRDEQRRRAPCRPRHEAVRQPRVRRPRPPQGCEDQEPLTNAAPGWVMQEYEGRTCVNANTKTRSKNSSIGVIRCSTSNACSLTGQRLTIGHPVAASPTGGSRCLSLGWRLSRTCRRGRGRTRCGPRSLRRQGMPLGSATRRSRSALPRRDAEVVGLAFVRAPARWSVGSSSAKSTSSGGK